MEEGEGTEEGKSVNLYKIREDRIFVFVHLFGIGEGEGCLRNSMSEIERSETLL